MHTIKDTITIQDLQNYISNNINNKFIDKFDLKYDIKNNNNVISFKNNIFFYFKVK